MKKWISKIDILASVLVILALRALYSMDIAQAIVFVALSAFIGYTKWLDMIKKPDLSEEVMDELNKMKNVVSSLAVKNAAKSAQEGKRFF
jgi:hypothetical protein